MIKTKIVFQSNDIDSIEIPMASIPRIGERMQFHHQFIKYQNGDIVDRTTYIVNDVVWMVPNEPKGSLKFPQIVYVFVN